MTCALVFVALVVSIKGVPLVDNKLSEEVFHKFLILFIRHYFKNYINFLTLFEILKKM